GDLEDDRALEREERRDRLRASLGQRGDRLGLDVDEQVALPVEPVAAGGRGEAELLELPRRLVLARELEEELGALERGLDGAARQGLVAEGVHGLEVEDGLVQGADAPLAQDLLEGLAQGRLPLLLLGGRDRDRLTERA